MAFPMLEAKFSQIVRTQAYTRATVRMYLVQDGGIVNGRQQYERTLIEEWRDVRLDAGELTEIIVAKIRARLEARNVALGHNFPQDRLICSL